MKLKRKVFNSEIKSIDEKEMTLTALVSTDGVDRMGEVLDPKGGDLGNFRKNPVVLWAHNHELPPIGKSLWIKRSGNGIMSKVKFANSAFAQEVFNLYKDGFMNAFSVGFIPKEFEPNEDKKIDARGTFKKWELLEYSAVPVPANPEAVALAIQKGVLKNDTLVRELKADDAGSEGEEEPAETTDGGKEPDGEDDQEVEGEKAFLDDLDALLSENKNLKEEILSLKGEVSELRYKLYVINKKHAKAVSEITVRNLAEKTVEVMNGVIRKHQGKLD